ncbi:MAG: UDP-N-acetylmuramoyl-L-alanyl-D-glutamate--2,6-diaminopimelate ligase [Ruminococcaceae bacterium]|nr:UDP-N-acetylmuramoyl-L-alanyl-D-glutamate--2,6-diaminopimelate ligase [Oscillospiraceae bacterium]
MRLSELLKGIDIIKTTADLNMEISGICYDSRKAKQGNIFVAVVGYESDGHNYINSAVSLGAGCVLCEKEPEADIPYILIENTRRGLAVVSANWFDNPASKMKMIGVTGTNGKTTTTNLIKTMLEEVFKCKVGLIGTNCNMIGDVVMEAERTTPESYEIQALFAEMVNAGCEYVVMEVSSHALYLDRVAGIEFEIGIFSNLTRDHLDFHKTMEEYGRAKALLFRQSRIGIVNLDDEYCGLMTENATAKIFTYSIDKTEADLSAKNVVLKPDGISFAALMTARLEKVKLAIPGQFSVYNGLTALAALVNLGVDLRDAAQALSRCQGVKGRVEVVPTNSDFTVIIDYAHTPDALENVLNTVNGFATGRVVVLVGCGGDRDKTKRPVMGKTAVDMADFAIITSDNPRTEEPMAIIEDILEGVKGTKTPYKVIENRREAIGWAIKNHKPDDIIILAGKGHETYQIIGKTKNHFDEREVVREFLEN